MIERRYFMAKYIYPAIFTQENNNGYSVHFPDLESCYTQGDDLQDAMEMAQDILCLTLYNLEKDNKDIPAPSTPTEISVCENSFISLIIADTLEYRKFYDNKAVKKTLTIPNWLNELAIQNNINFSNVLQNALMEEMHLTHKIS